MIRDSTDRREQAEDQKRRKEEMQAQGAAAQSAAQQASQDLGELRTSEFLDTLRDPEVDTPSFGDLSDLLGPELSGVQMIANESEEDYRRHLWLNENRARQTLAEHDPGRLCQGPFQALAQGRHDRAQRPRPGLTEDEKRKIIEATTTVKTARQSLGKGSRGLKAVAESTAVSRVEHPDEDDSDEGRVRSAVNRVFR